MSRGQASQFYTTEFGRVFGQDVVAPAVVALAGQGKARRLPHARLLPPLAIQAGPGRDQSAHALCSQVPAGFSAAGASEAASAVCLLYEGAFRSTSSSDSQFHIVCPWHEDPVSVQVQRLPLPVGVQGPIPSEGHCIFNLSGNVGEKVVDSSSRARAALEGARKGRFLTPETPLECFVQLLSLIHI